MITFYEVEEQAGRRPLRPLPAITTFDDLPPDSIYSSFRTFNGNTFLYLEEHLARARRSAARLGWQPLNEPILRRAIHAARLPDEPDVRIRFDFWADGRVLLALIPFTPPPAAFYRDGVQVQTAQGIGRRDPLDKTADFVQARTHYRQTHKNVYEFLLIDEDAILEGFTSNFYGVRNGVLYSAGEGVLEGITRRIILELLPALNIPLMLETVKTAGLPALDEAAMSSSSRGLLPITMINGRPVADGSPGPIIHKLMRAYDEFVGGAVKTALE